MANPHALILRAEGTNCELETAYAWELVGATSRIIHIHELLADPAILDTAQILTIAGGFCYGDDVSAGKILATEIRSRLTDRLRTFIDKDHLILGICNGFQVLVKTGFLPGPEIGDSTVTLAYNTQGRYEDRWVRLKAVPSNCPLFSDLPPLQMPIAHAEGRIVTRTESDAARLVDEGCVLFKYVDEHGEERSYPTNPNGSDANIAALCDHSGRVIGLMPHPERNVHRTHHPEWTSHTNLQGSDAQGSDAQGSDAQTPDGHLFFEAAMAAFR